MADELSWLKVRMRAAQSGRKLGSVLSNCNWAACLLGMCVGGSKWREEKKLYKLLRETKRRLYLQKYPETALLLIVLQTILIQVRWIRLEHLIVSPVLQIYIFVCTEPFEEKPNYTSNSSSV